jgi:UDP-hydrolysing UDP-N-acetyl-D-glucosamine 2-epimerase
MGERPEDVHLVGCPRIDLVVDVLERDKDGLGPDLFAEGVGGKFDMSAPFLLVSQHPVTTEFGEGERHITETLRAVKQVGLPAMVFWPNADAGSEDIARGIRKFRERHEDSRMHFFKNLSAETYTRLLARTACLVGNSSSGIREGAFIGTPVVNIGTRQDMRQRGRNVIDVGYESSNIADAIQQQVKRGPYESEHIYGDGRAGEQIASILSQCQFRIQKRITY